MKTLESLVRRFVEGHPQDAGKALEELDVAEASKIIAKLSLRLSNLLLERLAPQKAALILETLGPVRTDEGRLIGVIKHDEALRGGQLEAFEDIQKMVGAGGDERALSPT